MPTVIKLQIERENTIIQNAIWNKTEKNKISNAIIDSAMMQKGTVSGENESEKLLKN